MDFNDSPTDAAYRAEARAWLAANACDYQEPPAQPYARDEFVARSRAWQKAKHAAGYTGITWPRSMGGQGLTPMHQIVFNQEQSRYHTPTSLFDIGLGMCIPTVFTHGSPEVVARYVAPALAGDEVWCQLFRAERGVRPRRHPDQGGPGWGRLGHRRAEGVDDQRPSVGLRHHRYPHRSVRPQAQGADDVRRGYARTRRRGAAAQADVGRQRL